MSHGHDAYHDAYREGRILSADPLELVTMLYQACSDAVCEARRRLEAGDIAGRSVSISDACDILTELVTSLDRERGGEIAQRLALLYDYMLRRLIEANCRQEDAPLAEVVGLLATLGDAWEAVRRQSRPEAAVSPWATAPDTGVAAHAWSF